MDLAVEPGTWFASMPAITADLATADLAPLRVASFAYVNCYQLIGRRRSARSAWRGRLACRS